MSGCYFNSLSEIVDPITLRFKVPIEKLLNFLLQYALQGSSQVVMERKCFNQLKIGLHLLKPSPLFVSTVSLTYSSFNLLDKFDVSFWFNSIGWLEEPGVVSVFASHSRLAIEFQMKNVRVVWFVFCFLSSFSVVIFFYY